MNIKYIVPPEDNVYEMPILKLDELPFTICEGAIDGCLFTTTQLTDKDRKFEECRPMQWYIT